MRANGDSSIGQSYTIVGWISSGSTKCEYAWSASCAHVVSLLRVDAGGLELGAQLVRIARPDALLLERVDELDALPRPRQVDVVTSKLHLGGPDRCERCAFDERLGTFHRVAVVGVRLVPLELRELRRVLVRDALVAEVLRELVHLLQPADDQPLEVELVGDAQIEVRVELVRVRDERLGEPAAVARLEDRRLDLDEALAVEVGANLGDDARARRRKRRDSSFISRSR